jgi:hypothetical protein
MTAPRTNRISTAACQYAKTYKVAKEAKVTVVATTVAAAAAAAANAVVGQPQDEEEEEDVKAESTGGKEMKKYEAAAGSLMVRAMSASVTESIILPAPTHYCRVFQSAVMRLNLSKHAQDVLVSQA